MDIEWLEAQYSTLKPDFISNTLEGCITFKIDYYGYKIEDSYDIKVDFNQLDTLGFPKVFDMSRKIYDISQKYDMDLEDLHLNPGGSFCIAIEGEEKEVCSNGFDLQEFFENGIEKFLFQMSYFDREGKFPWGRVCPWLFRTY